MRPLLAGVVAIGLWGACVIAPPPPPLPARAVAVAFDEALDPHGSWVPLPPSGIELVIPAYRPRWCFVHVHHFTHDEVWLHRVDEELVYHSAAPVPRVSTPDPRWVARETGSHGEHRAAAS